MIQVEALKAGYVSGFRRTWKEVLTGVSFHVPKGSITGYLGVNGAGKTTTIKVLVGINPPTGGTVQLGGHPVESDKARRLVGYFPEAPFFYDGLSGRELLDFYGRLSGMARPERTTRADMLLEEVGLGDDRDTPVRGYSKGMRQRLGLAQALIHDPELLILDEPLDGLDPMGRLRLREQIVAQASQGKTVFFSSHVLSDVETISDHLVVLDGGKIAYDGLTSGFIDPGPVRVEVRFSAPTEALAAVREAAGQEPEQRGEGSHAVLCAGEEEANQVVDAVRSAGGRLLALEPRRSSLEETFMARFGAKKEEASAATAVGENA